MAYNYNQGIYEVKNKDKYIGRKNPRYLSSYELQVFKYLDQHNDVIKWGAEVVVVPYLNPAKRTANGEPKKSRYIVDIYAKYYDRDGNIQEELIEIKPSQQIKKPTKGNKKQTNYDQEILTFAQNTAKWEAARKFAEERGMKFKILTEREIFK